MTPTHYDMHNRRTGKTKAYPTAQAARNAAERANRAHGATICTVHPRYA